MIDIGRVFSTSFAMLRQRFWLLLGIWAVFLAIQLAAMMVLGIGMAVVGIAGVTGLGAGFDDPAALGGMGAAMIVIMALFYGAYLVLLLAQQAAMVTIASPLEQPAFGAAMSRGFKSALPFFAIAVLLLLGYFALTLGLTAVIGVSAAGDSTLGGVIGTIIGLLFSPLLIFLACRFAVLIPVVAVDQVFNPVAALRRSWSVTRGKALRILLALIGFTALSLVVLAVPFGMIFGASFADQSSAGVGMVALGFLVFVPLFVAYTLFASAFTAALHCEVTGGGAERLEEVFA